MEAKISLDGCLPKQLAVKNGIRQRCCMEPVLFNLYICLVVKNWQARVERVLGIGVTVLYMYDGKLFHCYTRNGCNRITTKNQVVDDSVLLLASTKSGTEQTLREYQMTCSDSGLTVNNLKTKDMMRGREVQQRHMEEITVGGVKIDCVDEFMYLGSEVVASGSMDMDVER